MSSIKITLKWLDSNRDLGLEILRIYLGLGLLLKGINFMLNEAQIAEFTQHVHFPFFPFLFVHFIVIAHIVGGGALAIGIMTRTSALIQIPALAGAIFYVHLQHGLFTAEQTLEFTVLVLFMLVLFSVFGGGRLSVDHFIAKKHRPSLDI